MAKKVCYNLPMTPTLYQAIKRAAKRDARSIGSLMRLAIMRHLERESDRAAA